jgi:hypothetical protein
MKQARFGFKSMIGIKGVSGLDFVRHRTVAKKKQACH